MVISEMGESIVERRFSTSSRYERRRILSAPRACLGEEGSRASREWGRLWQERRGTSWVSMEGRRRGRRRFLLPVDMVQEQEASKACSSISIPGHVVNVHVILSPGRG